MGIILGIRKLLRLDNKTVEFDSDVVDATGLTIPELKYFMQHPCHGCFCSSNDLGPFNNTIDLHLPLHPHDLHIC